MTYRKKTLSRGTRSYKETDKEELRVHPQTKHRQDEEVNQTVVINLYCQLIFSDIATRITTLSNACLEEGLKKLNKINTKLDSFSNQT
ncbi:MAG: hypothetical protein F6K58_31425 [Symploca sp. SIO2E9]|nr:hypothetical protein [Symploca sp. SIO2E9]